MSSRPLSPSTGTTSRVGILLLAPAVALIGHAYHPWIGSPGQPGFFDRLAAAVAEDPTRWAIAHLGVAIGSGLLILAFLAIRSWLRRSGENRWSSMGLPFVVLGSVLYAMLPAMEFAPLGANRAGADIAAVQAGLAVYFTPTLLSSAVLFALGAAGFAIAIARTPALDPWIRWTAAGALLVQAATRFLPVGAAQLYVGPLAGVVALWPLAYGMRSPPEAGPAPRETALR